MTPELEMKLKAATLALGALVERQAEDIPWEYGAQVKRLRADVEEMETWLDYDPTTPNPDTGKPYPDGNHWSRIDLILGPFGDAVKRLQYSPIMRHDIAAAALELEPLVRELEAEWFRLEPDDHREEREAGNVPEPLAPSWGRDDEATARVKLPPKGAQ